MNERDERRKKLATAMGDAFFSVGESGDYDAAMLAVLDAIGAAGYRVSNKPNAIVEETCVGPRLLVNGIEVRGWLGTAYNQDARDIARYINNAADNLA